MLERSNQESRFCLPTTQSGVQQSNHLLQDSGQIMRAVYLDSCVPCENPIMPSNGPYPPKWVILLNLHPATAGAYLFDQYVLYIFDRLFEPYEKSILRGLVFRRIPPSKWLVLCSHANCKNCMISFEQVYDLPSDDSSLAASSLSAIVE